MAPEAPERAERPQGLASPSGRVPVIMAAAAAAAVALLLGGAFIVGRACVPAAESDHLVARPTPNVVLAVRDLSRLEATTFHIEKVIELTDEQSRLFGLVQAKDAILLVAVGDVVAGVDMAGLGAADVQVDPARHAVRIALPRPEIFSTAIDEARTHVYGRSTDLLAARREELEGLARKEAAEQMEKGARDAGILDRARASAERTVRALLQSLGFEDVVIAWKG